VNPRAIFHPRIEADVRDAMTGYDERSPGLGARFKRSFYETVDTVLVFPEKNAVKIDGVIRTRLMRPFPYLVFYVAEHATVFVLTVQYAGRKPSWLRAVVRARHSE
jgi:hypothetical protein